VKSKQSYPEYEVKKKKEKKKAGEGNVYVSSHAAL
jgi:hypothetical protein